MSATNATTNYSLPLFIGTDKPAWLVDWNTAMTDIDGQMKVNATAIQANATSISGLSTTVSAHTTSISTISGEISTLSTGLNSAQGAINTIQSLIGNGEPTTTDKTLIGAINEIYGMITGGGDAITANNVVYDNTTSGLTASNVQAAIDEVDGKDAGDIEYDNTNSGLTATNVQAAIDELASVGVGAWTKLGEVSHTGTSGSDTYTVTADTSSYTEFLVLNVSSTGTVKASTLAFTGTIQARTTSTANTGAIAEYSIASYDVANKTIEFEIRYAAQSINGTAIVYAR